MADELEKTQLEIARLQLEQEKHKLAQMQRRSEAVSGLGRGAAKVGEWAAMVGLWAVMTPVLGVFFAGLLIYKIPLSNCGALYPDESLLYLIGCAYGQNTGFVAAWVAVTAVLGGVGMIIRIRGTK